MNWREQVKVMFRKTRPRVHDRSMNAARILMQIRDALSNLNPTEVREQAHKPVTIELFASTPKVHEEMANYFAPPQQLSKRPLYEASAG